MHALAKEIRTGVRLHLKHSGFTIIVVIVLALGIGSTTAIFSIVDAVILKPLPYPNSDRVVLLREVGVKGNQMSFAEANFEDVKARSKSFEALSISAGSFPLVVTGAGEAVRANVSLASGPFFETMGVKPYQGRVFHAEEERYGGPVAALISYGFWQKALGGRTDFGQVKLNIDGVDCGIVGVMPPSFNYPSNTEIWMTRNTEPLNISRTAHNWPVIGLLHKGILAKQAHAELSLIATQLRNAYGDKTDAVDFAVIPLQDYLTRNVRQGLWLLLGAVGLLLLISVANFSNLLVAELASRQREFTIRCALGASRLRLARQLIIENLLLTLPAAALGVLIANFGVRLLLALDKGTLPQVNTVEIDVRVLLFACGVGVAIGVVMSFLPALRLASRDLTVGLKEAGRGQATAGIGHRMRAAMVVGQVSMTLVLLAGAGLLGRSFLNLMKVDPGFKPESAVAMTLSLPTTITPGEDERLRQFYVQLLDRVRELPGVTAVGGINVLPLADRGANGTFLVNNVSNQTGQAEYRVASAGYFAAMKIPLLRGRMFAGEDTVNSQHVAVISQLLAQRYWPNEDPLGKLIQFGNMDTDKHLLQIVGVVGDVRDASLEQDAHPTVYAFSLQRPQWWQVAHLAIVVRGQSDPRNLIPALRTTVQSLRRDAPVSFQTLEQVFSAAFDQRRFTLVLFTVFGVVAVLITVIGLYGMLSYSVAERRQEIGIRMALGAPPQSVLLLVIRQGLKLASVGVLMGLAAAFGLTRFMRSLLFQVESSDQETYLMVGLLLLVVAFVACWIPARRATRIEPLEALRYE
ncbi:MAG: ABC transporter permease [Pyrinomonadaceae bacterium]